MNKQSKILERTVVIISLPLTKTKINILSYIYHVYGRILTEALEYMWNNNITSWIRARKILYKRFREKYPDVPSHYIHEAIRDAYQRIKSFKKLKRRGLAKTDKPVVRRWSIGCDNQLWKLILEGVRIATYKGWINLPIQFHKLFWSYYNNGWVLRSSTRWKLVENKLYLFMVFVKSVEVKESHSVKIYGIDINENNITIYKYPSNKAITMITNFSKIILGYAYRRSKIQQRWSRVYGVKGNRRLRMALRKLREKNVKRDIKHKLARIITNIVRDGIVVLEKLPKGFQDEVIEKNNRLNGLDVHRLKQSSIHGVHKLIVDKLMEYGIPYVFVNPSHTSSTCPVCGSKLVLMTGYAQRNGWRPRIMKCPKCRFIHDRDVIGAINIANKYLLDVGLMPLALKGVHDLRAEWLVATVKHGAEAQPVLARPTMT